VGGGHAENLTCSGFSVNFFGVTGVCLIGADYSHMEMRATVEISGDDGLRQIYADGLDLYKITASVIAVIQLAGVSPSNVAALSPSI
jgi:DNA polymerase I-like protein with 3'-5' exonuclease and polymerase domains